MMLKNPHTFGIARGPGMSGRKAISVKLRKRNRRLRFMLSIWFYPKPTGDPGHDRNARTVQFACFLLAFAVSTVVILNVIARELTETPLLVFTAAGLVAAMIMNRTGRWEWAARTAFLAVLLTAILLVFEARDGFRSLAMLLFPGMLLLSVMLLDRASYMITAGVVLVAVAALGIAERQGLTRAIPRVRSSTTYESIFFVDLNLLVFAVIGSRIARDTQSNVFDLRSGVAQLSVANLELKRANEALRQSEERFRNMADAAPVMIWVSGPDKTCTFVNKPWLDFTGRSMEQELGVGWSEDVHLEDRDRCLATYNSSCDARHPFEMEYRLRRADEEYRWVLDNGTPLYRGGEFVGFIGSCIDITERKLIEERLRTNEARLKDAQRLAKVGSWERHLEADSIQWSEEMIRIFGLPNGAPSNFQSFLDRVHPKDRERILETDRKNRSSLEPVEVEHRIIRPDGEVRFVRAIVEAIRNDQGKAVRLTGATQDVTEQVVASELLRQSERRLKNAERLAHLGHWQWDLQNNHLIWSEECFHIFGQPSDYTPSLERLLQALVPEDRERVERETGHRLAEKKGGAIEFRIVRPDGDLRTIRSISEMLLDEEGQPASFFGACQDITEERHAQEESFARQKLESVGTLASGIAHDFNNLLGGVLAQAELGLGELAAGSNPEAELKAVRDAAVRGSEIVRELMIYAGKESAVVGLADASQIVQEMLELLKVSVSKHAKLEGNLGKDLPPVRANAAQLRQIVMNLITNASDAMVDRDGVIGLTTKCVKIGRDSGAISDRLAEGDYVQLEVSDTGHGMLPETQAKVFDPFFTTKSAGRGLGLAVVQGIVRDHGGTIDVVSVPGQGATFLALLPCTLKRPLKLSGRSSTGAEQANNKVGTILVVEDEELLRVAVSKALRKRGFSVIGASDGTAGMDLMQKHKEEIDVLLLDVTLPGRSSREILDEVRRIRPNLKVILTSAYDKSWVDVSFTGLPITHFIRKPFQLSDLVSVLQDALSS
jgi:two-component system cell cycle sensor histidine kinase/response regulator CckA